MDFYFAQKTFFPKNLLPNSGCGLSTGAAYTLVNTVFPFPPPLNGPKSLLSIDGSMRLPYISPLSYRSIPLVPLI